MKELKFIHITKTGGTSIEHAGKSIGLTWGRHHKEYGWWHQCFSLKPKELREKYDWFVVVRNPFDRIVSEFHCKWGLGGGRGKIDQAREEATSEKNRNMFNTLIMERLRNVSQEGHHFTQQYKYLDGESNIEILRFENLESDFTSLMRKRGLSLKLKEKKNVSEKVFTQWDLLPDTLERIREVYKEYFNVFNYSTKIEPRKAYLFP